MGPVLRDPPIVSAYRAALEAQSEVTG
jgi:hypothetical protein